ncbi:hypothetical protein WKW79_36565 [Variovorax robiniae]|uniref:Transposase IS4-like domain-containing protein n=1 Tax=Variovorax robiniae TaxID=1836199 RepID=A0ABU8XJN8_9BURK
MTSRGSDAGELPGMVWAVQGSLGALPAQMLADTSYKAEALFEELAGCQYELVVAVGESSRNALLKSSSRGVQQSTKYGSIEVAAVMFAGHANNQDVGTLLARCSAK